MQLFLNNMHKNKRNEPKEAEVKRSLEAFFGSLIIYLRIYYDFVIFISISFGRIRFKTIDMTNTTATTLDANTV